MFLNMDKRAAEILALQMLSFVAADTDMMDRFALLSGIAPNDMLARAGDPEALAALMDFVLSDETLLTQFCAAHGVNPETPARARHYMIGGDLPHWT